MFTFNVVNMTELGGRRIEHENTDVRVEFTRCSLKW